MVVLESRNVTKDYPEGGGTLSVLKGVSLNVNRGEVVALEGPSGSGKTTLLFVLGCMLTPTSGQVMIEGQTVDRGRPSGLSALRKKSIGFVFQHFHLIPALTAAENVEYALSLRGIRGSAARRETDRVISAVGLTDRRNARPRDLSGGQKQRVAIARALAGSAPLILADEPTANLDSETGEQILGLFRDLAKSEDRALLVVSHDAKVRDIADRVLRIQDGKLLNGEDHP
jgi:putative ABC transport system ATP-binding protein